MSIESTEIMKAILYALYTVILLACRFVRLFVNGVFNVYRQLVEANTDWLMGSIENSLFAGFLTAVTCIILLAILKKKLFPRRHIRMNEKVQEVLDFYNNPRPVDIGTFMEYYRIYVRQIKPYRILSGTYFIYNTSEDMERHAYATDVFEATFEVLQTPAIKRAIRRQDCLTITIHSGQPTRFPYY